MKKVCLLFLISVQFAYGQNNIASNKEDSLHLLVSAAKVDTQKFALLTQLVDIVFGTDMQKALVYSQQGVRLADKLKDKNWQPKFYEMEGRMHANLLHLDSAMLFFQ